MKSLLLIFLLVFAKFSVNGQITVISDPMLDSLIQIKANENRNYNSMDGYRIQLFSGNNRTNAEELKLEFFKNYPQIPVYLIYQQPYFKIRVGDFRNKIEAQALYQKLLKEYGQAILVPDKINLPKL